MLSKADFHLRLPPAIRYAQLAAAELSLSFRILDQHSGYLCEISNGHSRLVLGAGSLSSWPANSAAAASLASDKAFSALVLRERGIAVPAGETIFLSDRFAGVRAPGRERADCGALSARLGWPLVAKPNNGSRGAFVQLCSTPSELELHLDRMSHRYDIGLLQEYLEGDEYRVFVYNGAVFSFRKRRLELIGNGSNTVAELVADYNVDLTRLGLDPIQSNSSELSSSLLSCGFDLSTVPPSGFRFPIGIRANLAAGGAPEAFTTDTSPALAQLACDAVAALGLVVGGVDIIRTARGDVVLEVNSNPTISSLETVGRLDIAVMLFSQQLSALMNHQ